MTGFLGRPVHVVEAADWDCVEPECRDVHYGVTMKGGERSVGMLLRDIDVHYGLYHPHRALPCAVPLVVRLRPSSD